MRSWRTFIVFVLPLLLIWTLVATGNSAVARALEAEQSPSTAGPNNDAVDYTVALTLPGGTGATNYRQDSYTAPWILFQQSGGTLKLQGGYNGDGTYDSSYNWYTPEGVEFNYLESHYFDVGATTSLDGATLTVGVTDPATYPLPDELWVSLGGASRPLVRNGPDTFALTLNGIDFPLLVESGPNVGVQQLTLQPIDPESAVDTHSFGNRSVAVFTGPRDGYWGSAPSQTPLPPNAEVYRVSDGSINNLSTRWEVGEVQTAGGPYFYALYVGGLFGAAGNGTSPLVLDIDDDFLPERPSTAGPTRVTNLSSSYIVYDTEDSHSTSRAQMQALVDQWNAGNYTATPNATAKGIFTQPSVRPLIVTGTGRINGWNLIQGPYYGTGNISDFDQGFYRVAGEMLRYSTANVPAAGSAAIDVSGVTVAWSPQMEQSSIELNDLGNPMVTLQQAYDDAFDFNQLVMLQRFEQSPVKLYDYKQLGSWVGQSDGPETEGWGTYFDKVYLHVNDDSVKVRSPQGAYHNVTVLQGDAGFPVSYAYGYVNQGVYGSFVDGLYAHRVIQPKPDQFPDLRNSPFAGLVWMAVSPAADNWYAPLPQFGFDSPSFTNTGARDVYVPSFVGGSGKDANSVARGMTVMVGTNFDYAAQPSLNKYDFLVQDIGVPAPKQSSSMSASAAETEIAAAGPYDTWRICPRILDSQGSRFFYQDPGTFEQLSPIATSGRTATFSADPRNLDYPGGAQVRVSNYNNQLYWGAGGDPVIPDVPDAPTQLSAKPMFSAAEVSFTFGYDGGIPVTDVEYSTDGVTWMSTGSSASTVTVPNLYNGVESQISLRAVNAAGPGAASAPVAVIPRGAKYDGLETTTRVFDSRPSQGGGGPIPPATPVTIDLNAPANAVAVAYNATLIDTTGSGHVAVGPAGADLSGTSTLNWFDSDQRWANAYVSELGDGKLDVMASGGVGNSTNLIVDVVGYYLADTTSGEFFSPVSPLRAYDSRVSGGPIAGNESRKVRIDSAPAGTAAVAYTLTVADTQGSGHLSVGLPGQSDPATSVINWFATGQNVANSATAALDASNSLEVFGGGGPTEFVIDVLGYFTATPDGLRFTPIDPARAYDSRPGQGGSGPLSNQSRTTSVEPKDDPTVVPDGVGAVAFNLTEVDTVARGHLRVGPTSTEPPVSTINWYEPGMKLANGSVVAVSADTMTTFAHGTTNYLIDVGGYYN